MIRFRVNLFRLFFFFIFLALQVHAAGKPALKDSVSLQGMDQPRSELDHFRQDKNFKYSNPLPGSSFFSKLFRAIEEWYGFRILAKTAPLLFYLLLFLSFVLLIVILFSSRFQGVFIRNQHELSPGILNNEIAENIDFNALMEDAARKNNFNLAVRYLYLSLLRLLDKKQLITYASGKSNYEYLNELPGADLHPLFKDITRYYEYAWYGKSLMEENDFNTVTAHFKTLTEKIDG